MEVAQGELAGLEVADCECFVRVEMRCEADEEAQPVIGQFADSLHPSMQAYKKSERREADS